tara:strand:- start:4909 stop:5106 length:198 start_codon:yes stop_codon:yes gene_type:complete
MFAKAKEFNQDLGEWDVSKVLDMSWMFANAINFNQSLENWSVANVRNMEHMFNGAILYIKIDSFK